MHGGKEKGREKMGNLWHLFGPADKQGLKDLVNTANFGTYFIVLDLKTMSTDKIPPKIDTVVILGCFLMADFDFQPHFGPPTFTPKLAWLTHQPADVSDRRTGGYFRKLSYCIVRVLVASSSRIMLFSRRIWRNEQTCLPDASLQVVAIQQKKGSACIIFQMMRIWGKYMDL